MAAELHKTNHRYKINDIASLYSRAQWEKMQPLPEDEYGYFELFLPCDRGTGSVSPRCKYPKYVESDRGLNQSVSEAA
jgi:hypothetical protein